MKIEEYWDEIYSHQKHLSIWPWTDLVSLFMRYAKVHSQSRILELGCGAGANIPFFQNLGADYHAIEGSQVIVDQLHEKYEHLKERIIQGNFSQPYFDGEKFDVIVDRASVTNSQSEVLENIVGLIREKLRPGGMFIGVDWYSTENTQFSRGETIDQWTRIYNDGPFAGVGTVGFSDLHRLEKLFTGMKCLHMEHKVLEISEPEERRGEFATFNFVYQKLGDVQ